MDNCDKNEKSPKLLTLKEASDKLNLTEKDVLNMINNSELQAIKIGSIYRINSSHLDQFILKMNNIE